MTRILKLRLDDLDDGRMLELLQKLQLMVEECSRQVILWRLQSYQLSSLLVLCELDLTGGANAELLELNILGDLTHVQESD